MNKINAHHTSDLQALHVLVAIAFGMIILDNASE
jgi:hypothetical protein